MRELVGELLQPILERHRREELDALPAGARRTLIEHHASAPSFVTQVVGGGTDDERVERGAAVAERSEHLLVMAVAELWSFDDDRDDDRTLRFALLDALAHLENRVEEIRAGIRLRPDPIDASLQVGGA